MLLSPRSFFFFFFNDTATTEIYTLSLHDSLPISNKSFPWRKAWPKQARKFCAAVPSNHALLLTLSRADRKSTRLNSSHQIISYAVFCLKKKNYQPNLLTKVALLNGHSMLDHSMFV